MKPEENGAQLKPAKTSTPRTESRGVFRERSPELIEVTPQVVRRWTRRDFLTFGAGAIVALGVAASQLPPTTLRRLGLKFWPRNQWLLNKAQRFDDDVAESLYSPNRLVVWAEVRGTAASLPACFSGKMGLHRIISQSRSERESRPLLRFD